MPWLMNRYIIGAIVVALLLGVTHWRVYNMGTASIQVKWDRDRAAQADAIVAAERDARKAEQQLQDNANTFQTERQNEISALRRKHDALIDSLRQRTPRNPGRVPNTPSVAEGGSQCTGAELHREDGEFLVGEAARADALRVELEACYRQYDAAREMTRK